MIQAAAGVSRSLLTVEHLTMRFGGLVAIDDLSFSANHRRNHGDYRA